MPVDPAVPLQKAIYAALTAPGALPVIGAAQVAVYDRVPDAATPPYVVIGDDDVMEAGVGEYVAVNIHVWSRQVGRVEAKTIAAAVRLALSPSDDGDTGLDASAWGVRVVSCFWQRTRLLDDPDGVSKHAIVMFRVATDPIA